MTAAGPDRVRFLIVGTPRSGTTLAQRLATELPGVVVPFETHFFTKGLAYLRGADGGVLAGDRLRSGLVEYASSDALDGAGLDADAVMARLDPGAPPTLLALFDAVVATLAGPSEILGEKTPGHLHWAAKVAAARPDLAVVAVVRDPRAAIASQHRTPWGGLHVDMAARRWLDDQRAVAGLVAARPDRTLVLRYEDLVADPHAARAAIAGLLGIAADATDVGGSTAATPNPLALPWETWKSAAGEPITAERVEGWTGMLGRMDLDRIGVICEPMLERFGYGAARTRGVRALLARPAVSRRARRRRRRYQQRSAANRAAVTATEIGA